MKAKNTLKGQALRTYNKVMNAMAEDNDASMLHTFAALTQQAKSIALQSGKFSNAYVCGELKGMTAEEAAKDLTARAAACVTCKVRNIDMIIAIAFLAEYISRQRKEIETPNTTTPTTSDTMNTETKAMNEETKSVNDIMNQANRLMSECNAKRNYKRTEAIRKIAFRYFDNIRACAGIFNSNDDAEYNKQYSRAQYMKEARNKENRVIFNDLWNKYNPSKAVDADALNCYKKYYDAHKKDFKHWKKTKASIKVYDDATEAGLKTPLKVGDVVCFTNDYGVKFAPLEVMGFCDKDYLNGRVVFLNTDSYWFPVRPESLEILMSF